MIEVFIIFILILLNGVFSMSEIALVSSRKFKLENMAAGGHKGAKKALELANNPGKFLSTVQVGITLIGIIAGVYGGASIAKVVEAYLKEFEFFAPYAHTLSTGLVVIFITYFTLILGELFPKQLGLNAPERISATVAIPMSYLSSITKPIIWLLENSTRFLVFIFRVKQDDDNTVSEEEIRTMLDQAAEVEKEEKEMVDRVFFLGDTDVGSLMTHRDEIILLNMEDEMDNIKNKIAKSGRSQYPVYKGSVDNVIGVLSMKNFTAACLQSDDINLEELLSEPLFVTEQTKAFRLLESMKKENKYFAIAVNEYGHTMGVITSNDLFKVIAGNLYKSGEKLEIVKRPDGSFLVDGLVSLDEFFRYFKMTNTENIESKGFYTLGGMVLHVCGHIPKESEKFKWRNLEFEVVDMDGKRVDKVMVRKLKS